ncbi:MAG TPA: hypothetical protein VFZ42_01470 [Chitinophagaceae bacterium]
MKQLILMALAAFIFASCDKESDTPRPVIISGTGNITAKVNEFRALLGSTLNTTKGHTEGRREINWDGVPDMFATQKLPFDFFNPVADGSPENLQRGFLYSTDTDARISSSAFTNLEPANGTEFFSFSGSKTFSAVSSNLWNVEFEVAGARVAASVNGFGAVFSDVDDPASTSIEYFSGNRSLGTYFVPVHSGSSHSFLGVYFPNEKVTKVRIMQGAATVGAGVKDISVGGTKDLVIMDDFLYDEPVAIQ